jgi:hypothetical protein
MGGPHGASRLLQGCTASEEHVLNRELQQLRHIVAHHEVIVYSRPWRQIAIGVSKQAGCHRCL